MATSAPASCDSRPVFWQRQPRFPLPIMQFLRDRLTIAMEDPAQRSVLAWPTILGAPRLVEEFPDGIPFAILMKRAASLLGPMGLASPEACWERDLDNCPDTAELGPEGWKAHRSWLPMGSLVSLRAGVTLLALMGHPEGEAFPLSAASALFNSALYHECHDVLEPLWGRSRGHLKADIQGLILLTAGFHHQQLHNAVGMVGLWEDAVALLAPRSGELETPWGTLNYTAAVEAASTRLAWMEGKDRDTDLAPLWDLPRPTWELL